jgi:ceramide glucosyltransferase
MPVITWGVLAAACLPLAYYAFAIDSARRFAGRRRGETRAPRSPVSVLKPVRGLDADAYRRYASVTRQIRPGDEILFGVADPDDPAIVVIRRVIADFPEARARLVCPIAASGPNGKMSIVCRLAAEATHDLLVVADSDVLAPPSMLRDVLAPLADPRVGAVTCLYRGSAAPPTLAGDLEALGISTEFAPGVLVARRVERIRFALGAVIATRRECVQAIGGFGALVECCADDFELGRRIAGRGYEVRIADCVVSTACEPAGAWALFRHELRWAATQRQARPWAWTAKAVVTQGLPWCGAAALLAPSPAVAAGYLAAYAALRVGAAWAVGVRVLGDDTVRRRWWLLPVRDLLTCAVSAAALVSKRIEWRGQSFVLDHGRLVPVTFGSEETR